VISVSVISLNCPVSIIPWELSLWLVRCHADGSHCGIVANICRFLIFIYCSLDNTIIVFTYGMQGRYVRVLNFAGLRPGVDGYSSVDRK
jgi:uncharacterized membrane protein